jgi:hypothetical protein
VNLGVERFADLRGSAGEIYDQSILIDAIDGKAVAFEPMLDGLPILPRNAETFA